jgi:signal transduction histidine kinase
MRWQRRTGPIRQRVVRVAVALLGLLLVSVGVSWLSARAQMRSMHELVADLQRESMLISHFSTLIGQELHAASSYLLRPNPETAADFHRLGTEARQVYRQLDRDVERTAEEARLIAEVERRLASIEILYATAHRLADLGRFAEAEQEAQRTAPLIGAMLADVDRLGRLQRAKAIGFSERIQQAHRQQTLLLGVLFGTAVAVAGLLSRSALSGIVGPLDTLVMHARRLREGDFSVRTDSAALPTELGALADTLNQAGEALQTLAATEGALREAEKMAALGRVTARIAHEINSPLGSVLNSLQVAHTFGEEYRASAGDPEVTADDHRAIAGDLLAAIEAASAAAGRASHFVRTIKEQTRLDDESRKVVFEPDVEIDSTLSILRHQLGSREVTVEVDSDRVVQLYGDPHKFAMIVQNLIANAADAYEGRPGVVRVRLFREGAHGVLEVGDSGCGITEEIRDRIFDHLFTTKEIGMGTGLGLATVRSFVTSHFEGQIDLLSEVGRGTTFSIRIPLFLNGKG